MSTDANGRVGILWRGDRATRAVATPTNNRLRPVFDALAALNVTAEPVVFDDDIVAEVRAQLLRLDGVLVWVDPIMGTQDRSRLDALLREVASSGVWVSAHPDVILKMGTKEILVLTRDLGCGSDTYLYRTLAEFTSQFPARLSAAGPRVVKQLRGNAGIGVWKVSLTAGAAGGEVTVDVQHAHPRDIEVETVPLAEFMRRCEGYFAGAGSLIDQPFQPRIADGMVRCYVVRDEVAGFAIQGPDPAHAGSSRIFGLPAKKTMYEASEPPFARLKAQMESAWLPAIQRLAGVDTDALPLLWDADFLYGPKNATDEDTYVLCEVNVSSVFPFPDSVPSALARAVVARLAAGNPTSS